MKKIIASITLICYLTVTGGVIVNFHYCMDRLASTQLFGAEQTKCGKCGMHKQKSHGCCRDEVKIVKMNADQKTSTAISFELNQPVILAHVPSAFISTSFINDSGKRHFQDHSPPLLTEQDTYLQNCVFRI